MSTPAKKPRQAKTPRQRAEETLGRETRKHDKFEAEVKKLEKALAAAKTSLDEARARCHYAASDPAFKTKPDATVTSISTPATGAQS